METERFSLLNFLSPVRDGILVEMKQPNKHKSRRDEICRSYGTSIRIMVPFLPIYRAYGTMALHANARFYPVRDVS